MKKIKDGARLGASVYLLKKLKTKEATKEFETLADSVYPLVPAVEGGMFATLPADAEPPKWLDPLSSLLADGGPRSLKANLPVHYFGFPAATRRSFSLLAMDTPR